MKYQRQIDLLQYISQKGNCKNDELLEHFKISKATLNRDLNALEKRNCIRKIHGGAVSNEQSIFFEMPLPEKEDYYKEQKERIAKACLKEVHNGDVIVLDSGTTMFYFAKELVKNKELKDVFVITNDIKIAYTLCSNQNITLYVIGGLRSYDNYDLHGSIADTELISNLNISKYFMASSAFDVENGVTHMNDDDVKMKSRLSEYAKKIYLCCDSSKESKVKRWKICALNKISTIITDKEIDQNKVQEYQNHGIEMILV